MGVVVVRGGQIVDSFYGLIHPEPEYYQWFCRQAMDEMSERAQAIGADAVIGIDIDYEVVGENGGMLMVTASGTAVKLGN